MSRVGSGGCPALSEQAAPNRSSRNRQSIALPSFTKRVSDIDDLVEPRPEQIVCPLSRRSFGRIESPSPADKREGITADRATQFAR